MLYQDLETQIIGSLGNRDDDTTKILIMANFNYVQRLLAKRGEWEDLQVTSQGYLTQEKDSYILQYELEVERLLKFYNIKLNDGSRWRDPLGFLLPNAWDIQIKSYFSTLSGIPTLYTIWEKNLFFNKIPDAEYAYEIRYYQYPSEIVGGASIVQLEEIHQVTVAATIGYTYLGIGERENALTWLKLAGQLWSEYSGDNRSLFDFQTSMNVLKNESRGNSWSDPFQKESY